MKLKDEYLSYDSGSEHLLVAAGRKKDQFHGLVRANESAALVIGCLKQETTLDKIVDRMADTYDASREVLKRDAQKVVETLRGLGMLEE